MFINVPKEIIGEIFNELDGMALTKCSFVCFSWNESSKRKKTWKKICHQEIDSPTLKDILYKTSPDLKRNSWQNLYRSWYLITNRPHRWTLKENKVKRFGGNLKINQAVIIKGYVIVTVGEMIVHLYCLETQKWSDSYELEKEYDDFKPIELKGQVYLVFVLCNDFLNFSLQILKVEKGKFSTHPSLELTQFEGDIIRFVLLHNNNLISIETDDTNKLFRLEQDPSNSNLVRLQLVKDIDFWFITWNDLLVREAENELTLYSLQGDTLSVKATISFIENESYNPTYDYYCTPRSLFLFKHKAYYEINETNGNYEIIRYKDSLGVYHNYLQWSLRFHQCFSNIFLTSVESDSDIEDLYTIRSYKISNIIEYLLEDYKRKKGSSEVHDVCFHNDELVIIRTNRDKITIHKCSISLVGNRKRSISSPQNPTPKRICPP